MKGELDELEPWVAEDVDTVWNAATSMAVILNDVLDLGQVCALGGNGRRGLASPLTRALVRTTLSSCNEAKCHSTQSRRTVLGSLTAVS